MEYDLLAREILSPVALNILRHTGTRVEIDIKRYSSAWPRSIELSRIQSSFNSHVNYLAFLRYEISIVSEYILLRIPILNPK